MHAQAELVQVVPFKTGPAFLEHSTSTIVGSRPFEVTNRLVLAIAIPMTLAYLTTPLLGLVGTAVVGQFGDAALLGGLAAGAVVFDVVFATFNFLRSGTSGLVAQALGRGDLLEERAIFWRAFTIAVAIGLGGLFTRVRWNNSQVEHRSALGRETKLAWSDVRSVRPNWRGVTIATHDSRRITFSQFHSGAAQLAKHATNRARRNAETSTKAFATL